jgi:hypothetical protein
MPILLLKGNDSRVILVRKKIMFKKLKFADFSLNLDYSTDIKEEIDRVALHFRSRARVPNPKEISIKFVKFTGATNHRKFPDKIFVLLKNRIDEINKLPFSDMLGKCDGNPYRLLTLSDEISSLLIRNSSRLEQDFSIVPISNVIMLIMDTKYRKLWISYEKFNRPGSMAGTFEDTFDFALKLIFPHHDSFLMHCAALKIGKSGFIFTGDSGSGKTTISKIILGNIKKARLVADDETVVSWNRNRKEFYAWRFPFDKRETGKEARIDGIKIKQILFIRKSKKVRFSAIPNLKAVAKIFQTLVKPKSHLLIQNRKLALLVLKFVSRCYPAVLEFPKNNSFLNLLKGQI